ncbi:MAG TPA: ABC transporter permease, partial [Trebonia sp.]|nr:ABC transporter permease [Trebonia sp.]
MTAATLSPADLTADRSAFIQSVGDVWVLTKRSLARIRREPETLSNVTIQPVMFILMFAYVFGGAIG